MSIARESGESRRMCQIGTEYRIRNSRMSKKKKKLINELSAHNRESCEQSDHWNVASLSSGNYGWMLKIWRHLMHLWALCGLVHMESRFFFVVDAKLRAHAHPHSIYFILAHFVVFPSSSASNFLLEYAPDGAHWHIVIEHLIFCTKEFIIWSLDWEYGMVNFLAEWHGTSVNRAASRASASRDRDGKGRRTKCKNKWFRRIYSSMVKCLWRCWCWCQRRRRRQRGHRIDCIIYFATNNTRTQQTQYIYS